MSNFDLTFETSIMKIKNLFFVLFLLNMSVINGQNQFLQNQQNLNPISDGYLNYVNNNKDKNLKVDLSTVNGTPYGSEEFILGKAYDILTQNNGDFYMRYNIYNDAIETKTNLYDKNATDLIKSENIYVKINDNRYHFRGYIDGEGKHKSGYFILISSRGTNRLYLKKNKKFIYKREATNPYESEVPASFKDYDEYYFEINNSLIIIPEKKKTFLKQFPEKKNKLSNFFKKEKINLKKKDDLVRLLNYYSTDN